MIIQCDNCSTKFRIDDSKVTPSGVKVRCTKCQNVFVAKQPQSEELPKQKPQEPEAESAGAGSQRQGADTSTNAPQGGGFDFSSDAQQPNASQTPAEPDKKDYSIGSAYNMTEGDYSAKDAKTPFGVETGKGEDEQGWKITNEEPEGLASSTARKLDEKTPLTLAGQTKKSYDENNAEAMSKDLTAGMDDESDNAAGLTDDSGSGDELTTDTSAIRASAPETSSKGTFIVWIIIALLILAGGYAMRVAVSSSPKKPQSALSVETITGAFAENKNIGKVFIIQSKIKNTSDSPQQVRGIMGAVYDASGKKLSSRMVSPGRTVSAEEIKNMTKDELLKQFKDAKGADIPPKGTVPAMIVFTEPPSNVAEYGIDILR